LQLTLAYLRAFGFTDFEVMLSTRPAKYVGEPVLWDRAEDSLRQSIAAAGLEYGVDEGGGAFYGPKIDVKIKDALGRTWQCSTIQLDFNLPRRFNMSFTNSAGEKEAPILVHRAVMGSLERFFGILIEHYAGDFPLWMAPEQVRILTVSERADEAAKKVLQACINADLRADGDLRNESLGRKIRDARLLRVPLLIVIGDDEVEQGTVALRTRQGEQLGTLPVAEAVALIAQRGMPPSLDLA
jgi:threonyl-tRNA synthetase